MLQIKLRLCHLLKVSELEKISAVVLWYLTEFDGHHRVLMLCGHSKEHSTVTFSDVLAAVSVRFEEGKQRMEKRTESSVKGEMDYHYLRLHVKLTMCQNRLAAGLRSDPQGD